MTNELPAPVDVKDNSAALAAVDAVIAQGPFDATWESLANYEIPLWFQDAKFGIFLHWGVFSVPAYHDWYARNMYIKGSRNTSTTASITGSRRISGSRTSFRSSRWKRSIRRRG